MDLRDDPGCNPLFLVKRQASPVPEAMARRGRRDDTVRDGCIRGTGASGVRFRRGIENAARTSRRICRRTGDLPPGLAQDTPRGTAAIICREPALRRRGGCHARRIHSIRARSGAPAAPVGPGRGVANGSIHERESHARPE